LVSLLAFLVYLVLERLRLGRALGRVPCRIAVTGTRGKSGVTRLVAAGLRESGRRVLAKTTGSEPVLILADGSEELIARPGPPSIREQVRLLERANRDRADILVTELMSVGPECLFTECRRIVRPGLLAVTNVRLDHVDAMGHTKEEVARTLSAAFPEKAAIFLPAEEARPAFAKRAQDLRSRLVAVGEKIAGDRDLPFGEFEPNVRLALAVLDFLGVDRATALRGMGRARPDFGRLKVWRTDFGTPPRPALCVSAFAANDPESSAAALARVKELLAPEAGPLLGLLCLREDRGDRTLQWVRAAAAGFFDGFESVTVLGRPALAVRGKLRRVLGDGLRKFAFSTEAEPVEWMDRLVLSGAFAAGMPLVLGLGNIVGQGERFVRYWSEAGSPYEP
jgi:poly-gamma-glutamate synthase PgsB/CapB